MNTKKLSILMFMVLMISGLTLIPVNASTQALNAAGTTGAFDEMNDSVQKGFTIAIAIETLTASASYILVPTAGFGITNITFTPSSATFVIFRAADTAGLLTLSLFGEANGINSSVAIVATTVTITNIDDFFDVTSITDFIPFILILIILVGLVMGFKRSNKKA